MLKRTGHVVVFALSLMVSLGLARSAQALETFAFTIPNRISAKNDSGVERPCITCHNNPDGGTGCEALGGTKPCLNPFGMDFKHSDAEGAQDRVWTDALGALDSDGDGFTNAQELQVLRGSWSIELGWPGNPAYVTAPGNPSDNPGKADGDKDRHCWVGFDINKDGDCLDEAENGTQFDCDDANKEANSARTEELCQSPADNDCDGLAGLKDEDCANVADQDGDGFCREGTDLNRDGDCLDMAESEGGSDCDDAELTVNSGASENCLDGRDNDCDTKVDFSDTDSCTGDRDEDGDGVCALGRDLSVPKDGDCKDAGENSNVSDCDDRDAAIGPDASEVCRDGADNNCNGFADLADSACFAVADRDGDGHCPTGVDGNDDGDCLDENEADPAAADCDDTSDRASPSAAEDCLDTVDNDCDTLVDLNDNVEPSRDCAAYVDTDMDGYCVAGEDFVLPRDGLCIGPGETLGFNDCAEDNALASPLGTESCTDGVDNDCDGSSDAGDSECRDFVDRDRDGYCHAGKDLNRDGDCADASEQSEPNESSCTRQGGVDPDERPSINPGLKEHCRDNLDNDCDGTVDQNDSYCTSEEDADEDGYCPLGQDLSVPRDGDCLDEGERLAVSDCDDAVKEIGPGGTEDCRNAFDDDCDTFVDLADEDCDYLFDRDHDGFCGLGFDANGDGDCLDAAEDTAAQDCDDSDSAIFPGSKELCDDELDNDCDGLTDAADASCPCTSDAQCEDHDVCTTGACRADHCKYTPVMDCQADAGVSDAGPMSVPDDGGTPADAGSEADAGASADPDGKDEGGGCACSTRRSWPSGTEVLLYAALASYGLSRRRRRDRHA